MLFRSEAKAAHAECQLIDLLGGRDAVDELDVRLLRLDTWDAPANERATAHLRVTAKDQDRHRVGRVFSNAVMEIALAGYAGFHTTSPPGPESAYGIYRPARVPRSAVAQTVVVPGETPVVVADPPTADTDTDLDVDVAPHPDPDDGPTRRSPLGAVLGARSGDKGGDANIGVWARDDAAYAWARRHLTVPRLRELLGPEAVDLDIERFELPNLRALNVVVHGLLGEGVASSTRPDPQAKGLGEFLRSRVTDIPVALLDG